MNNKSMRCIAAKSGNFAWCVTALIVCTMALSTNPVLAQPSSGEDKPFSGSLAIGAEHNDNLSIAQLESAAGRSDTAVTVDGNLNFVMQPGERTTLETGYNYTMSRYNDMRDFDLDMHLLFADLSHELKHFTLGANYYFASADLGRESFLTLNQYSLYAGKLFGESWYLRGALNFIDKDFDTFRERDADNNGFSLDLYHFFNQGRSSISFGYAYEDEETLGPSFVYTADTLRLRFNHRFTLASRAANFQIGLRSQDRDYPNITPSINAPRNDSQLVMDARLEVTLIEKLALVTRWERGDYSSRLPSADFSDNRLAVSLQYTF